MAVSSRVVPWWCAKLGRRIVVSDLFFLERTENPMGMEANQFDLLVEDVDNDNPSLVIAATEKKVAASRHGVQSKLLTKPLPSAQAGESVRIGTRGF
jgi:hypothetical protein